MNAEEPQQTPPDPNSPPGLPIDAPASASFEGWGQTPAPDLPPDPPPPAWRWETTASLAILAILALMPFIPSVTLFLMDLFCREAYFMLPVTLLAFGLVLGFSGARQGGHANRFIASVATIIHMLLLLLFLFMPVM